MKNLLNVYRREMAAYFNSPIAYIFVILFLLFASINFFNMQGFFSQQAPNVRGYFALFPMLIAVFSAPISMRLWAEEKRTGTIELLMTWPVRAWELVVAKYLSGLTIWTITLVLAMIVPITVSTVTDVDWGVMFSSFLGSVLVASVYMALGAWISTFTRNQVVALLLSAVISALLCYVGYPGFVKGFNDTIGMGFGNFVGWFSTQHHFQEFAKGLIHPVGVIYGIGMTAVFLVLNNLFVEGRKF